MADKVIGVREEVHQKVAQIAKSNYRGIGDQVAYWADHTCAHPQEDRVEVNIVVSPVQQATKKNVARVGKGQPFRGFFCTQCGQYVFPDLPEDVNEIVNLPVDGEVS